MNRESKQLSDYTAIEFMAVIQELMDATGSTEYQDQLLEHFIELSEHPSGSDLIYFPSSKRTESAEEILQRITEWRASTGLTGFKEA